MSDTARSTPEDDQMQNILPCNEENTDGLRFIGENYEEMSKSSELWIVLGVEHEFYYSNDIWYHWHSIRKSTHNVAGKIYSQIPHEAYSTCSGLFEEHDRMVIDSKKIVPSIEIHQYNFFNGWMAIFSETIPVIHKGEVVSLIVKANPLPHHYVKFYKNIQSQCWDEFGDMNMYLKNPEGLHDAYFDTVYLYMLGFKAKEISHLRRVSESTVRNILVNVRTRFGLDKTKDIIDYAIANKWYSYIPSIFRGHNVSFVNKKLARVCQGAGRVL